MLITGTELIVDEDMLWHGFSAWGAPGEQPLPDMVQLTSQYVIDPALFNIKAALVLSNILLCSS